jgi:flagellar assembly factor FliW
MLAQQLNSTMAETAPPAATDDRFVEITNKIGTFRFDRDLSIHFPQGMVGFPDAQEFGMADMPESLQQFKLLQCINEPHLSFIVLPATPADVPIDAADLENAMSVLKIQPGDLALLFVITIRALGPGQGISMSINHAAPIMVDTARRTAKQFVFSNNKYQVQHQIG